MSHSDGLSASVALSSPWWLCSVAVTVPSLDGAHRDGASPRSPGSTLSSCCVVLCTGLIGLVGSCALGASCTAAQHCLSHQSLRIGCVYPQKCLKCQVCPPLGRVGAGWVGIRGHRVCTTCRTCVSCSSTLKMNSDIPASLMKKLKPQKG